MRFSPLVVAAALGAVVYWALPDGPDHAVSDQVASVVRVMTIGAQPQLVIAQATSDATGPSHIAPASPEVVAPRAPHVIVAEAPVVPNASPSAGAANPAPKREAVGAPQAAEPSPRAAPRPPRAIVTGGAAGASTGPAPSKPTGDAQRRALAKSIQQHLTRVGCYDGAIDGTWSPATRRAMQSFTDHVNARLPTQEPDDILLTLIQGYRDKACNTCATGEAKAADGRCLPRSVVAKAQRTAEPKIAAAPPPAIAPPLVTTPARPEPKREAPVALPGRMTVGGPSVPPREAAGRVESWIPPPSESTRRRELAALAEATARVERDQEAAVAAERQRQEAERRQAQAAEARRARQIAEQSARDERVAALAREAQKNIVAPAPSPPAILPPVRPTISALDGPRATTLSPSQAPAPVVRDITVSVRTSSLASEQKPAFLGAPVAPAGQVTAQPIIEGRAPPPRTVQQPAQAPRPRAIVRLQPAPSTFRSRIFSDLALRAP